MNPNDAKNNMNSMELVDETIEQEMKIPKPKDYTPAEELFQKLLSEIRKYHPSDDLSMVEKAYYAAKAAHEGQVRKSGEPYIIHPVNVALILAELELDKESIIAGLLHDVVEDTVMTHEDVAREFGQEVADLVEGVTKVTQIDWGMDKEDVQAENLRKMFMAMANDIRVILVKLADRLHNMRTSAYWSPETQKRKAKETLEIFSPVADRLGISKIKIELDDRSLAILHPDVVEDLTKGMHSSEEERQEFINDKITEISARMEKEGIKCKVVGRVKHLFSIYKKMVQQHKTLDQIYDIFAIRLLCENVIDCYAALGVVHEMYTPLPGRFKDYIAMPKPNRYQSLHTTLIGKDGTPFEIQIRTFEMHMTAEYGIAAHWNYKEHGSEKAADGKELEKMNWLRQVLEFNQDSESGTEFLDMVKSDLNLMSDEVYCFTPKGEVKQLPLGSTPIDFAYLVHTAVGNRMVGARVNGKLVPIDYVIQNGDQVDIITSQNSKGPSMDWLNIVKSTQAKNKINAWFKTEHKEDNIIKGRDAVANYCKTKAYNQQELMKPEYVDAVLKKYALKDWESVLAAIGHGALKEGQVVAKLQEAKRKDDAANMTDEDIIREAVEKETSGRSQRKNAGGGITIRGIRDVSVHYAHCCNPVPGDEIVGFVTRGRGVTIHRTDCVNMIGLPPEERNRLIEAEWESTEETGGSRYSASLNLYCKNRMGMVVDVSRVFTEEQIDITSISVKNAKNGTGTLTIDFETKGKEELNRLIEKLRQIPGVVDVERSVG